jgi:hypothetical protein
MQAHRNIRTGRPKAAVEKTSQRLAAVVAVGLMLAALLIYVLTVDEALLSFAP